MNPFDQFASDFQAALPPGAPGAQPPAGAPDFQAGPPSSQQPQQQQQQPPMMNSGPFGAPPGPPNANPFGGGQQLLPPPPSYNQSPQTSAYGGPPPPQQPYGGMPPPAMQQPGAGFATYGQAPPPPNDVTPTQGDMRKGMPNSDTSVMSGSAHPPPQSNPFGMPSAGNQDPAQPPPPPGGAPAYGADPWGGQPQPPQPPAGGVPPYMQQQPPYGAPPAYGAPPGQPDPSQGALVPSAHQSNPYAPGMPGQPDPNMAGAIVPSAHQSNPYAMPYGQGPPQNPYGAPPPGPYGQPNPYQQSTAPPPPSVDPFSVFEAQSAPPPQQQPPAQAPPQQSNALVPAGGPSAPNPAASDDDFWGSFSAHAPAPSPAASGPAPAPAPRATNHEEKKNNDEGLPPGGEWYDARIFTPTLGVMFFKPQELTDSLFLNTDKSVVDALGERPTVAFIVEGSSARSAGVELGHVLLKVNGVDVRNPKDASRLIKEGPRPLPLLFYVPSTDVVVAEGEHMVKYDTRDTTAPNSAKDWKPKYVVIGGIIAQPWMMNMYRSKSEYDIAVIETQARRPVSVKVKQFSLQGARIQNDWQGAQMVKYKNKLHPWKYIVVLPIARNPIKISSPNLAQLKPVHEGIRRVLLAQQRDRGYQQSAAPVRDSYRASNEGEARGHHGGGGGGGGGYDQGSPPRQDYGGHGYASQGGGYPPQQNFPPPQQQYVQQQPYRY